MKIIKHGFLAILLVVAVVHAQADQSGFISLDCGLPSSIGSYESDIGITYISDEAFVTSGVSKTISPENQYPKRFAQLRAFPEGIRNCYTVNVTRDTTYSIRASFYYGNYDNRNFPPQFYLHLGPNLWDTIDFFEDVPFGRSIIHLTKQDYVQVCLVSNGTGVPFISALELRPMSNDVYKSVSGSLILNGRFDLGSTSNQTYRYPFDSFDRAWDFGVPAGNDISNWTTISTTLTVNSGLNYKVPPEVMRTAITPLRISDPLLFGWLPFHIVENSSFDVYFHFAEIQKLKPNESRAFDIYANGELINGPVIPDYLSVTTIYKQNFSSSLSSTYNNITLVKRENSTLPPILNAIELYTSQDILQLETNEDDVKTLRNIKSVYGIKRNWDGDPCGPVAYAWEGLTCSNDGHVRPRVNSLNLSSSGLTGEITAHISKLTMLQSLDLSNNNLVGSVPKFLSELPNLRVLKLENNKFTGTIPAQLIEKSKNGSLTLSVGRTQECTSSQCKRKKNNIIIPIGASIGGLVLLLSVATATLLIMKRNTTRAPKIKADLFESKNRQFTYSEVLTITNNFKRVLGKGGFGAVYHGIIDNTQVAVKMLSPTSNQGYQQFEAEVKLLMTVHHRNLTRLIGYCNEGTNMTLIYEYMTNGDLESHLSDESRGTALNWERRLKISLDAAQGLEYLHHGCRPAIVHRDIKNANILLTENFQAKLADFGLSKSFPTDSGTHVSTVVAGTPGYLDPEYFTTNRLTEKSDVYSFGVVLLQIITSRAAILRVGSEWIHISDWIRDMLGNGDITSIIDQRLKQEDFEANSVWKAVEIAMACVSPKSTNRPNMSQVVIELKECLMVGLPQRNNHSTTDFTNTAQIFSFADSTCDFPPSPR